MKIINLKHEPEPPSFKILGVLVFSLILLGITNVQSTKAIEGVEAKEVVSISNERGLEGSICIQEEWIGLEDTGGDGVEVRGGLQESNEPEQPEDIPIEKAIEVTPEEQKSIEAFIRISKSRNPELISELGEIIQIAKEYNFDYKTVLAMIAEEGAWGGSHHCKVNKQCLGYGVTDSGDMGFHYEDSTYAEAFREVLSRASGRYGGKTISEISYSGWNTRQSWRDNISLIYSYF